jgi:large subunit ribosomal protein L1
MPNPKTGTVTMNIAAAIEEIKKGKVTYRTDKEGNVAVILGKTSFETEKLVENYQAIYDVILKARPAAVKGTYMKNVTVCATMSPSVKVEHLV